MAQVKVGDRVRIDSTSSYYIGDHQSDNPKDIDGTVQYVRSRNDFPVSVEWDNGKCNVYRFSDLVTINDKVEMTKQQLMIDAVKATADRLLKANNTVTTLEIKVELRKTDPEFYWSQVIVSKIMDDLAQAGTYVYTDNGSYRIYSSLMVQAPSVASGIATAPVTKTAKPKVKATVVPPARISRKNALYLMQNSKGHFFTAVFTKQDGTERTINCQYLKDQANADLGYVKVKETGKLKTGDNPIRQINLQTLKALSIGGNHYKVR